MAKPRSPYESTEDINYSTPDISTNTNVGPKLPDPSESAAPAAPPLLDQAKALYGGKWDSDAQQQFDLRASQGQSANDILAHTGEDFAARFPTGPQAQSGGGSSNGSGGGGQSGGSSDLISQLAALGQRGPNQDIINARVSNARDTLERQRKSSLATDKAALASRGLLGSGPEITAMGNLDSRLADQYANAVTDIYANENGAADNRMLQALTSAAGLESQNNIAALSNALGMYQAETARQLGIGNLALGNQNSVNDYNLGLANFGLNRDKYLNDSNNTDISQLIELIQQLAQGANISAGGYY